MTIDVDALASVSARDLLKCAASGTTLHDQGAGRVLLVLHGGGGLPTVLGLAEKLSARFRVITPTHPGFGGSFRPASLNSVSGLARLYHQLLAELKIKEIIIVGSSIGGWIASEMAIQAPEKVKALILINAVGISVPGETIADPTKLSPAELARLAFHDPVKSLASRPAPTPEQFAMRAADLAALSTYDQGLHIQDPTLLERLATLDTEVLVLWGESDGVVRESYGRVYAGAFARGQFKSIREAGHLPQIEQPDQVFDALEPFIVSLVT